MENHKLSVIGTIAVTTNYNSVYYCLPNLCVSICTHLTDKY